MAHELAHVVQQGAGEATVVRRFFIYAAGYKSPYKDEAEETASIKAETWMRGRWILGTRHIPPAVGSA